MGERIASREVAGVNAYYAELLRARGYEHLIPLLDPRKTDELLNEVFRCVWEREQSSSLIDQYGLRLYSAGIMPGIEGRKAESPQEVVLTETGERLRAALIGSPYKMLVIHGGAMDGGRYKPGCRMRDLPYEGDFSTTMIATRQQFDNDPYWQNPGWDSNHYRKPSMDIDIFLHGLPGTSLEGFAELLRRSSKPGIDIVEIARSVARPGFERVEIKTIGKEIPPLPEGLKVRYPESVRRYHEEYYKVNLAQIAPARDNFGRFSLDYSLAHFLLSNGSVPAPILLVPTEDGIQGIVLDFFDVEKSPGVPFEIGGLAENQTYPTIERFNYYLCKEVAFPKECFPQAFWQFCHDFRSVMQFGYVPLFEDPRSVSSEMLTRESLLKRAFEAADWFSENIIGSVAQNPTLLGETLLQRKANGRYLTEAVVRALEVSPYAAFARCLDFGSHEEQTPFYFGYGIFADLFPELRRFLNHRERIQRLKKIMKVDSAYQELRGGLYLKSGLSASLPKEEPGEMELSHMGFVDFSDFLLYEMGIDIHDEEQRLKLPEEEIWKRFDYKNRILTPIFCKEL